MTGERWEWYRVASHLKIPVRELRDRITITEFHDWLVYLQKMETEPNMIREFYQAQIAAEIVRGRVENPSKVHIKDFLVKLKTEEISSRPEITQDQKDRATVSKRIWGAHLNLNTNKKVRKK